MTKINKTKLKQAPKQQTPDIIKQLKGFNILPIPLPHLNKIKNNKSEHTHKYGYLYYKPHTANQTIVDKTLFVINIPTYFIESQLNTVFSRFGDINDIQFVYDSTPPIDRVTAESQTYGIKHAIVVYNDNTAINKAMQYVHNTTHDNDKFSIQWCAAPSVTLGVPSYIEQYYAERPDINTLEKQIDTLMHTFDTIKQQSHQNDEPIVDSDGFQLVTYNHKNLHTDPKLLHITDIQSSTELTGEAKRKQKRKEKQVVFMYKHQLQENKQKHVEMLQQQFARDKLKIQKLKEKKKLKLSNNT